MNITRLKEWLLKQMKFERDEASLCDEEDDYNYHCGQADAYNAVYNKILQAEKGK